MTAAAGARLNGGMATAVAPSAEPALVPPQNLDAEESVLGAMLLSPGAIGAVTELLDAGDFYRQSHGTIYKACLRSVREGEPVDAITVADQLEERGELDARRRDASASMSWRGSSHHGECRPLRAHRP